MQSMNSKNVSKKDRAMRDVECAQALFIDAFPERRFGSVKATSPDYWSLFRLRFPDRFAAQAERSRRIGARLTRINDERIFIDEIPADWPVLNPIAPACDFLCALAEMDIGEAA